MLLLLTCLVPAAGGVILPFLPFRDDSGRKAARIILMAVTDILGAACIAGGGAVTLFRLADGVTIALKADGAGKFFLIAVLILYTVVTVYAHEYFALENEKGRELDRFFAFMFVSLGALLSAGLSANLVTLYFFFELATLSTVPLVLHEMTKEAVSAGLKYLFYSIAGALLGLLAVFFVYSFGTGSAEFVYGGFLDPAKVAGREGMLLAAVFAGIVGFGTKAGLYPMHGWLPTAHPIAPAPASALLSAIVTKAGVLAIIRLVYYSVGAEFLLGTWVQRAWMCLAMLTIFMGSMMAFREKVIKKRLAYSSISQISYILLALSTLSPDGLEGGLLHLMSHMAAKGTLFLAAGVFIAKLGRRRQDELKGIGKLMPVTLWCYMFASLSLVGIPPMGGFLSKWVIASALINHGSGVFAVLPPVILIISALLTAGYLFPVVIDGFFPGRDFVQDQVKITALSGESSIQPASEGAAEPTAAMTAPMLCLSAVALIMGIWGLKIVGLFV